MKKLLEKFENYCKTPGITSGKAKSYSRAIQYLCDFLNESYIDERVLSRIKNIEKSLPDKECDVYKELLTFLENRKQSSYLVSGFIQASLPYFFDFWKIENSLTTKDNDFPDSAETETCIEGAKITIQVNKYERNTVARQKCIDELGCYCHICGINFEKVYGEIGKDFIHVHHKIPLNEIKEEYVVDPSKDLLPVCPNCHAMLHRKINGKYLTIEELKQIFAK